MLRKFLLAAFGAALLCPLPAAFAQESVVVTGSRIQSDDEYQEENGALPYVSTVAPADFVLFTVFLTTGTTSRDERVRELERTFTALSDRVKRTQGVTLEVGDVGDSAPMETAAAREAINVTDDRSYIDLVMKFAVRAGDTFPTVRTRAEAFIEATPVTGRVQAIAGDDQYIGVNDTKKHREDLLRKIAEDTHLIQSIFTGGKVGGLDGVSLVGLGGRVKSRPVGPLEIEMFIPYSVVVGQPLPQPPPR